MIETHWICDVCEKRVVGKSEHKDANETGIQNWFSVNLNIKSVSNSFDRSKSVYKYGYACSIECLEKVIDWLKKLAKEKLKESSHEK